MHARLDVSQAWRLKDLQRENASCTEPSRRAECAVRSVSTSPAGRYAARQQPGSTRYCGADMGRLAGRIHVAAPRSHCGIRRELKRLGGSAILDTRVGPGCGATVGHTPVKESNIAFDVNPPCSWEIVKRIGEQPLTDRRSGSTPSFRHSYFPPVG